MYLITRLLGRFAAIFYFDCEHVLFVYIEKQNKNNFVDFKNLIKFEIWWMQILEILIIQKFSLGPHEVPH